jgi:hypothetical protein
MLSDRRSLVQNPLLRYSFILQVVVSRNQRMAGVSNYASKTAKNDAPERVKVVPGYWSFNYLNVGLQTVLSCLLLIGAGCAFAHDRRLLVDHFCGNAALLRAEAHAEGQRDGNARVGRTCWAEFLSFSQRWSIYVVLIEIPSIMLPLLFELLMPFLQVLTPRRARAMLASLHTLTISPLPLLRNILTRAHAMELLRLSPKASNVDVLGGVHRDAHVHSITS